MTEPHNIGAPHSTARFNRSCTAGRQLPKWTQEAHNVDERAELPGTRCGWARHDHTLLGFLLRQKGRTKQADVESRAFAQLSVEHLVGTMVSTRRTAASRPARDWRAPCLSECSGSCFEDEFHAGAWHWLLSFCWAVKWPASVPEMCLVVRRRYLARGVCFLRSRVWVSPSALLFPATTNC